MALLVAAGPFSPIHAACPISAADGEAVRSEEENNGIIKGKVTTSDGQPAAFVNVQVSGSRRSTLTDESGNFTLRALAAGEYDLEISLTGFATTTQHVSVVNGLSSVVSIQLQVSAHQLQAVVVTGGRNKFARTSSDHAAKMPLKNIENAQVYTTITKELMDNQLVFSLDDAIRNAPGIQKMWEATGRSGDGGSYYNSRGFILQSQLRNGIAGNVSNKIDAANIERIEVLKGPSDTLFGSSLTSYGGLIRQRVWISYILYTLSPIPIAAMFQMWPT